MVNKNDKIRKFDFFAMVFLVGISLGWIDPMADNVREGNEMYHRGAYDEALDKYVNAQIHAPQVSQLDFNIADTQYQRKKYDEAAQLFEKVVKSGDPEMKAKASFNRGNTLYRQGKMKEAMECYKNAVDFIDEMESADNEPIDTLKNNARYNYEYVERKMKENEQKQQGKDKDKNQDQEQKDQQQKQENKDEEEEQHPKEDKDEEKEKQESQNDQQEPTPETTPKSDEHKKEHSQEQPDKDQQEKDKQEGQRSEQPQPTQPQDQKQMSKDEAQRFLDALNHAEKETRLKMRDKQRLQHKSVEKDW